MNSETDAPPSAPSKRLVLDANILIRAVLGRKVFALLDAYADQVDFITAYEAFEDARTYLPDILAKRGVAPRDIELALETVDRLTHLVSPVPEDAYRELEFNARARLTGRDEEDWPFVALALLFGKARAQVLHMPLPYPSRYSRTRSEVQVGIPLPKKSRSSVQMGQPNSRAKATNGQSSSSRPVRRARASVSNSR